MKNILIRIYLLLTRILVRSYLSKKSPFVIGICGSVGKTSCRMIIAQTLQKAFPHKHIFTSSKNFNGEFGLPLSVFQIDDFTPGLIGYLRALCLMCVRVFRHARPDVLILEYGVDHPGEMQHLLSLVKPHMSVLTLRDQVHSLQFGNADAIVFEESQLLLQTKETVFLNVQEPATQALMNQIACDVITYATKSEAHSTISYDPVVYNGTQDFFKAQTTLNIGNQKFSVTTNLIGSEQMGYVGVGLAATQILAQRRKLSDPTSALSDFEYALQPGRSTVFVEKNSAILDSSYNAAPESMQKMIHDFNEFSVLFGGEKVHKILLLGDMRELGDQTVEEHEKLIPLILDSAHSCLLVGEVMSRVVFPKLKERGSFEECKSFLSSREAGAFLKHLMHSHPDQHYVLLAEGSQNTIFLEEALKYILPVEKHEQLCRQSSFRIKQKESFFNTVK